MPTDAPPSPPRPSPSLLPALRTDLEQARFTVERTEQLLGPVAVAALHRENPVPARRALEQLTDPAGLLFRLFTLGATLPRSAVETALPTLGAAGAIELGILSPAGDTPTDDAPVEDTPAALLRSTIDLSPYSARDDHGEIAWWIASDLSELATGAPLHPGHVLGVGGASLTLARITPRERVGRVLDLGCGGGIQALHASRHADQVVATDLSARALAFAAFNAALNGVELELREGSLLAPVAGETFDLIISNPPFVITPRSTLGSAGAAEDTGPSAGEPAWTYRDGGSTGDALLGELARDLPRHLAPGGRAVMLGNWEITADGSGWDAHPRAWFGSALADGVDCWVIQREREDPAQYAETWARDGGVTDRDPRWAELLTAWLDDFAGRNVAAIGFGYQLLHRPVGPARPGVLRTEEATGTGSGTLAEHLAAGLDMIDRLTGLDDDALAALRPVRAADVIDRRHLTPGEYDPVLIELVQGAGFARAVPADQVLAATVGALDGTLTLAQTLAAVCALTGDEPEETRARILPAVRELLTTGMLKL